MHSGDGKFTGRRRRGGTGGGITKGGGSQEKGEKFHNIHTIFCNRKSTQRWEPTRRGQEPGVQGAGGGKFRPPCPPPPPPPPTHTHTDRKLTSYKVS